METKTTESACNNQDNNLVEVYRYKGDFQEFVLVKSYQVGRGEFSRCPECKRRVEVYKGRANARPYWKHIVNKLNNKNKVKNVAQ